MIENYDEKGASHALYVVWSLFVLSGEWTSTLGGLIVSLHVQAAK
jgi:hypothetical protein